MKEKELEDYFIDTIEHISESCYWGEIERFERQYILPIKNGRIIADVMIWHKDGTGTCVEIKTGTNNRNDDLMGISQLLLYGTVMEELLTKLPRLVLVRPEISPLTFTMIERFNLPIALLQLTDNKCIYLSNGTKNNTT